MEISFRKFTSSDKGVLAEMILGLYTEDPSDKIVDIKKIDRTFEALLNEPTRGTIMVFEKGDEIAGYSILINFWSNEFGGNILIIDELFVQKDFRSQGIASRFIQHLVATPFNDSVALQLEVTPDNHRALALYKSLGFKKHKNDYYDLLI
ncbi:MAG: GNAT family N-acetyltransferase [Cytophagia bacterium]|nr:GNAT family N-acetyltransferase [Cytophagia bacterium]